MEKSGKSHKYIHGFRKLLERDIHALGQAQQARGESPDPETAGQQFSVAVVALARFRPREFNLAVRHKSLVYQRRRGQPSVKPRP